MLNEDMGGRSKEDRSAQAGEYGRGERDVVMHQMVRRIRIYNVKCLLFRLQQRQESFRGLIREANLSFRRPVLQQP